MNHALGQLFLFVVLVGFFGTLLLRAAADFRAAGSGKAARGGRTGTPALRSPGTGTAASARTAGRSIAAAAAHPGRREIRAQAKADTRKAWTEARSTDWLEQRRHERQNGGAPGGSTATATRPTVAQRLRLRPFTPGTPDPHSGGSNGNGGQPQAAAGGPDGAGGPAPGLPDERNPGRTRRHLEDERRRNAGEQSPSSTNGGTTVAGAGTSTASAEKLIEGTNEIHAHAAAGGIHAKQEAIKSAHEGLIRFSAMVQMLARQMSEPGSNYGHEITEPLGQAGQHCQAAAMSLSESDAAITTLINMTVGDLAASPRQAPHHSELSESGTR